MTQRPDPILRGQPVDLQPGMVCAGNRNGAMDAYKLPSRMGNRLHYRDGRVETI